MGANKRTIAIERYVVDHSIVVVVSDGVGVVVPDTFHSQMKNALVSKLEPLAPDSPMTMPPWLSGDRSRAQNAMVWSSPL